MYSYCGSDYVNMAALMALIIPAMFALVTFYFLNRELSHSLITVLRINCIMISTKISEYFFTKNQEIEVFNPNIVWNVEIKFPPQLEQLLRDLYENENSNLFVTQTEHNTILKLSANVHLKNGLVHLYSEIRNVIAKSIQEFAKKMKKVEN